MENPSLNASTEKHERGNRRYRFAPVKRVPKRIEGGKRRNRSAPVQRVAEAEAEAVDEAVADIGWRGYPPEMFNRRIHAVGLRFFRRAGECNGEKKICISACGIEQWHENLYGIPRVVVHGVDSLCAVARTKDVEDVMQQVTKAKEYATSVKNALIYEAEDLALPPHEVPNGKMSSRTFKKPFIAVSVVPGPTSGHEASGDEYDVDRAIMFLKEQMASGTTFNFKKTVETAIFTLEHLFRTKFEDQEIRVFYVQNHSGRVVGGKGRSEKVNEFPTRAECSIMDHLAVLSKPDYRVEAECRSIMERFIKERSGSSAENGKNIMLSSNTNWFFEGPEADPKRG